MSGNLRKFLALPAGDQRQLLWAALWLPLTHFRLRRFGLQSCLRSMGRQEAGSAPPEAFDAGRYEQARRCERSVALASRHGLAAGTCLSRSLTVMRLMARQGMAGQLRIGVNLESGALEAHAWVEFAGVPLGREELGYAAFPPLAAGADLDAMRQERRH